jgi:O-6-methylguanine DNA methyltransferase
MAIGDRPRARGTMDNSQRSKAEKQAAYCLFETPLGWCGIAWSERAGAPVVISLRLPEATREMTEAGIAESSGACRRSPPEISKVIERVRKHLQGEVQDFRDVTVDLEGVPPFYRRVYEAAREIPAGETRTYGELAKALNRPGAARAVGQALKHNPIGIIIPCHRVLAAGGKPGGFSAYGGLALKARLLATEGAAFGERHGQRSLTPLFTSTGAEVSRQ